MLHDLNTYLHKAIPDTKLTIRKYLDVKFEYLVSQQPRVSFSQSVMCSAITCKSVQEVSQQRNKMNSLCLFSRTA